VWKPDYCLRSKSDSGTAKTWGTSRSLAASIMQVGLLHPPVITSDNVLIAGARRVEAWRMLKGDSECAEPIPVRIVDIADIIKGEAAENFERKDFTLSEAVEIKRAIEPEGEGCC